MKKFLIASLLLFIIINSNFAQNYKRDTSFTIYSAAAKVKEQFPDARIVKPKKTNKITIKNNLVYAEYGDRKLFLDVFLPGKRTDKLLPAVILLHGGGWSSGDKSQQIPIAQMLAINGYISVCAEYRLSPESLYPASVVDINTSIKWLKANSKKFYIDTNKIALLGCSSGGQLAALVGTAYSNPKFQIEGKYLNQSGKVQAIIDIDGVLDMTDPAESGKDTNNALPSSGKRWFGVSYKDKPELWIEASSINYVNENTPPTLFINSSIERFHAGRDEYIKKLKKWNIYYEIYTIPNTPHPFWLFHPWFDKTVTQTINFLNRVFKKE